MSGSLTEEEQLREVLQPLVILLQLASLAKPYSPPVQPGYTLQMPNGKKLSPVTCRLLGLL